MRLFGHWRRASVRNPRASSTMTISLAPLRITFGRLFATIDSLGFWAGKEGVWECSYNRDGWISGPVPTGGHDMTLWVSQDDETPPTIH
jgi:hypothetical protein